MALPSPGHKRCVLTQLWKPSESQHENFSVWGDDINTRSSRATTALCLLPLCCSQGMPHRCGLLYIGCRMQLQRPWVSSILVLT